MHARMPYDRLGLVVGVGVRVIVFEDGALVVVHPSLAAVELSLQDLAVLFLWALALRGDPGTAANRERTGSRRRRGELSGVASSVEPVLLVRRPLPRVERGAGLDEPDEARAPALRLACARTTGDLASSSSTSLPPAWPACGIVEPRATLRPGQHGQPGR